MIQYEIDNLKLARDVISKVIKDNSEKKLSQRNSSLRDKLHIVETKITLLTCIIYDFEFPIDRY